MNRRATQRFLLIDILRGFAALAVLVWHYQHFYYQSPGFCPDLVSRDVQPFYTFLMPLYEYGKWAVQLFWVISGFVFFAVYRAENFKLNGFSFFVRRFSRLYPLHFTTLIIVALLQIFSTTHLGESQIYGNNDSYHFFLNLFLASRWGFENGFSFNAPIWSVSVEEVVYVVFFFYCRYLSLTLKNSLIVFIIFTAGFFISGNRMLECAMLFFIGGLVFLLWHILQSHGRNLQLMVGTASFFLSSLLCGAMFGFLEPSKLHKLFLVLFVFPSMVFLCAALEASVNRKIVSRFVWIGDITYSTYLLHIPVQITGLMILKWNGISLKIADNEWFFLSFLALVLLLSLMSYHFLERPAQSFLRKKLARTPTSNESIPLGDQLGSAVPGNEN